MYTVPHFSELFRICLFVLLKIWRGKLNVLWHLSYVILLRIFHTSSRHFSFKKLLLPISQTLLILSSLYWYGRCRKIMILTKEAPNGAKIYFRRHFCDCFFGCICNVWVAAASSDTWVNITVMSPKAQPPFASIESIWLPYGSNWVTSFLWWWTRDIALTSCTDYSECYLLGMWIVSVTYWACG